MKNLLGNSCAKGCLIYFAALIAIVMATGLGLGGLRGRFFTDPPAGTFPASNSQPQASDINADGGDGAAPTRYVPPAPTQAPQQPLPTVASLQPTAPPGSTGPGTTVQFTPVPSGGGVISGEASPPFYVVQDGDTLWEIALRFAVDVETLRSINSLQGDVIVPGQVLYLPQSQQQRSNPHQPLPAATQSSNLPPIAPQSGGGQVQPTPLMPNMPNTGIIRK
jgi:LysM repeat protein